MADWWPLSCNCPPERGKSLSDCKIKEQRAFAGETKQPYIRALQCAMRSRLAKATAMHPNAIFFLLHCGAKLQNYGLVLA